MANPFAMLVCSASLLLFSLVPVTSHVQDGKELFQQKCAGCHTIGGGDGVGPDLKGVGSRRSADWLVTIITAPDKLTADKDPAQLGLVKKYGMEMPKLGVSGDDARKIATFLQGAAGGAAPPAAVTSGSAAAPPATPAPAAATPQLVAAGRALFTGKTAFANGGAPCVSCHNLRYPGIYGGALAGDLTAAYAGMGESGMRGVLKSLGFPVMRKIYAERPLTEPETAALLALFQDASAKKEGGIDPYPLAGVGCFVVFIIAALLYKRRIG